MTAIIDPSNLTIEASGRVVRFTRCEFAIIMALIKAGGRCLTFGFLCDLMNEITGKEAWVESLRVHKVRASQKLSKVGLSIQSHYGIGYSMAKPSVLILPTAEEELAA